MCARVPCDGRSRTGPRACELFFLPKVREIGLAYPWRCLAAAFVDLIWRRRFFLSLKLRRGMLKVLRFKQANTDNLQYRFARCEEP